jgi:ABC-type phosphate/phosphonate transport system substrate-binding protein
VRRPRLGALHHRLPGLNATNRLLQRYRLKGDIHAFSDPDSNSGFLVTRALLAENRLLHGGFFSGRELPKAG